MLFREIIAVYFEKCTKHMNALCGKLQSYKKPNQAVDYIMLPRVLKGYVSNIKSLHVM
jgi:hypothetical protein